MSNLNKESFLTRAKELREKYKLMKGLVGWRDIYEPEVKQLKEKVEKGCGIKNKQTCEDFYNVCGKSRIYEYGSNEFAGEHENNWYCQKCQEALKILNEIIGDIK